MEERVQRFVFTVVEHEPEIAYRRICMCDDCPDTEKRNQSFIFGKDHPETFVFATLDMGFDVIEKHPYIVVLLGAEEPANRHNQWERKPQEARVLFEKECSSQRRAQLVVADLKRRYRQVTNVATAEDEDATDDDALREVFDDADEYLFVWAAVFDTKLRDVTEIRALKLGEPRRILHRRRL